MRKLSVILFAAILFTSFAIPAMAVEHAFGGVWRAVMYRIKNYTGEDLTEASDFQGTETRTRLYYTAILNDNLKFVNKFEFDANFGDSDYTDIGADGKGLFEIKESYADITAGPINAQVGVKYNYIARGWLFDEENAGATVTANLGPVALTGIWIHPYEGGAGVNANDMDYDYYVISPKISIDEMVTINPYAMKVYSKSGNMWGDFFSNSTVTEDLDGDGVLDPAEDLNGNGSIDTIQTNVNTVDVNYVGVDIDLALAPANIFLTAIFETGEVTYITLDTINNKYSTSTTDLSGYAFNVGGDVDLGMAGIRAQFMMASGDDDLTDNDNKAFLAPSGQWVAWSEMLGENLWGYYSVNGSPGGGAFSNAMAGNIGVTVKPIPKLSIAGDIWYAARIEDVAYTDEVTGKAKKATDLGTELNLQLTYELVENLNVDLFAGYLLAGDAVTQGKKDEADPMMVLSSLSLKF